MGGGLRGGGAPPGLTSSPDRATVIAGPDKHFYRSGGPGTGWLTLPRLLATAWASLGDHAGRMGASFDDGDVLGVLARALSIVALAIPILGILYVLLRLVRRTAAGI